MYKGEVIKILLQEQGRKQKELCEALFGDPKHSIQNLVDGKNPTAKMLEAMADFFEVPVDTFFERNKKVSAILQSDELRQKQIIDTQQKTIDLLQHRIADLEQIISLQKQLMEKKLKN